jgi:Histidine kinase-, DNA gyrase B-, and HSP90-like ATPase
MGTDALEFRIELNVLKHLGIGLYSSTPSVVTEIIANAWDADASLVTIALDVEADTIVVADNGHGMTRADVQTKFLAVGYSRRTSDTKNLSRSGKRRVMGRKGIGKLAMFSLAKVITVVTRARGEEPVAFTVDVTKLLAAAEAATEVAKYPVQIAEVPDDFKTEHGTRITLTSLNNKIHKTEAFLRPRLARRFGVFSDEFRVRLGDSLITRVDAGFYGDIQFLWHFDMATKASVQALATSLASVQDATGAVVKCVAPMDAEVALEEAAAAPDAPKPVPFILGGFIASVDKPAKLGRGDESLNRLAVFANGRLFQEDILPELGDARYFNSYLVGEIHADFLDNDDHDRATASRESIRHDDERFLALRAHLRKVFTTIRDQWDEWRIAQGYDKSPGKNPDIAVWLESLKDKRDRKAADRLMTSIDKLTLSNDEGKDAASKALLYRSAVVGFEKLRARSQLDRLDGITDVLSPEFQAIFASLDEIEASYYLDIVKGRLEVVQKFESEIVDAKKQERVAQRYLFDHLWLLDPTWDRVTGSEQMEIRMSAELKRACPDTTEGARLDIAYRTTAGRHVIIELKRPGLKVPAATLEAQGRKYLAAVEQYYREHPDAAGLNGRMPPIDIYFLVETAPQLDERDEKTWQNYNMKPLSYRGLIENARLAYQSYLSLNKEVSNRLTKLLDSLDSPA